MRFKKIIGRVVSVLCVLLIIVEAFCLVALISTKVTGSVPSVFGYSLYVIVSPSMEPELCVGDIIICKNYDSADNVSVGDIVTYMGKEGEMKDKFITHKVVSVSDDGSEIITKGDANNVADAPITKEDIVSVFEYKPVLTAFIYKILKTVPGFIILFVLPMLYLIVTTLYDIAVIRNDDEDDETKDDLKSRIPKV